MKLEPLIAAFFEAGHTAAKSADTAELHAFRIAAKRLRYSIEILDPAGGAKWLARLRLVQRQLGDMHDCFVAEAFLHALPRLSPIARTGASRLHSRGTEQIERFHNTWRRRFGPRVEHAWRAWAKGIDS